MRKMKLSEIKIRPAFAETVPSESKMEECRENWRNYHRQDRWIVVDFEGHLVDGYCMYLVLKENNVEEAKIKISNTKKKRWFRKNIKDWELPHYRHEHTTYIYGKHVNSNCNKEFVWRIPKSWVGLAENVQVGDTVLCATKFGYSPIVVTRVEALDEAPIDLQIKKVCSKKIWRNGIVVEL